MCESTGVVRCVVRRSMPTWVSCRCNHMYRVMRFTFIVYIHCSMRVCMCTSNMNQGNKFSIKRVYEENLIYKYNEAKRDETLSTSSPSRSSESCSIPVDCYTKGIRSTCAELHF